ncbi:MAG: replicative DNA helicase [Deltaproteobacteria bacterium]|nr:replicative DNA helicase [Deltaproteobacteria bacterium]
MAERLSKISDFAEEGRRLPPQALEAEASLLGALLIDPEALHKVADILRPEDFYKPAHQKIFRAALRLFENNEPPDVITLANELTRQGELEASGGAPYLAQLAASVATSASVVYYAKIIREKSITRGLIKAATEIVTQGYAGGGDVGGLMDFAEKTIFEISERSIQQAFSHVRDVVKESIKTIEHLYENRSAVTGVPTGYKELNRITAGLQRSDLIIVAGRPSMGKTAFALNLATNAALETKQAVAVFSLEMSKEQLVQRMLCSEARVDSSKLRGGFLKQGDWTRLIKAAGDLSQAPLYIDDTPALSVLEMRAKCRRLKKEREVGLIVVDYLQLMRSDVTESREREISDISRSLKALAKELHVPVIALSQLNRSVESRTDRRPQLSDLRECVTGETLVNLADGRRLPIRDLVGKSVEVLSVDSDRNIKAQVCDTVWSVGYERIFRLSFASGRILRATAGHRILTEKGWKELRELFFGDKIGLVAEISKVHSELSGRGSAVLAQAISEEFSPSIGHLAFEWDHLIDIREDGIEEVFDLTVPGTHSWLADGIVSHNSGAIEQDADVIAFIYRDEVYNKDTPEKGVAEIIIGKQRNGPIGTVKLKFFHEFTRFEELVETYGDMVPDMGPPPVF